MVTGRNIHTNPQRPPADGDDSDTTAAGQAQITSQGADDLLDEIDDLLEDNAEEFVRSYVQKGGQ